MVIIDGRKISAQIRDKVKAEVATLPFVPVFCDVLVGDNEVSRSYVDMKAKACEEVGMKFLRAEFPENISQAELEEQIKRIAQTENLCGLILQLPLPKNLNKDSAARHIPALVDVDFLNKQTESAFYNGELRDFVSPTPGSVLELLDSLKLDLSSKKIVIVGQGDLVGKPVAYLLKRRGLTNVSVIDKATQNPAELASTADVIISATGVPGLIKPEWAKEGSVVIDAGTAESSGMIVGDLDPQTIPKLLAYSPVPGGVGPVTVAKLLENVLKVARAKVK